MPTPAKKSAARKTVNHALIGISSRFSYASRNLLVKTKFTLNYVYAKLTNETVFWIRRLVMNKRSLISIGTAATVFGVLITIVNQDAKHGRGGADRNKRTL